MKKNLPESLETDLRQRAEQQLSPAQQTEACQDHEGELSRLLYELEMQNEELLAARSQLETSLQLYTELYDHAPIGYITLDRDGDMFQLNLKAASLLGLERARLAGRSFRHFVEADDRAVFDGFISRVFVDEGSHHCELALRHADTPPCFVLLKGVADASRRICRMTLQDMSRRRQVEAETLSLLQQNRNLTKRLFLIQEEERRQLSWELHDEFGQWLTVISLNAQNIISRSEECDVHSGKDGGQYRGCDKSVHESSRSIIDSVTRMQEDIRGLIHRLRPVLLDDVGLADSLRELAAQWQGNYPDIGIELHIAEHLGDLADDLEITLYRIVQEGLTNAVRHADASQITIELCCEKHPVQGVDFLMLSIADNGKGIDACISHDGFGLTGMRERVYALGGEYDLTSTPGNGLRLEICVPLLKREDT